MTQSPVIDVMPFLEEERIRKIEERLLAYAERHGGKLPEDDDGTYAKYLINKYSFCTSVLLGIMRDNVSSKRIVEVGPGYAGRFMIDFLTEEGADAIGTDPYCNYDDYSGPSKGRYVSSPMERLSESFNPGSIDLINVMSMHPDPCPREITKMASQGKFLQRMRAKKYVREYDQKVSENASEILKNKGYLTLWHRVNDFRLNPERLTNKGFSHQEISLFWIMPGSGFYLDIYQKDHITPR